MFRFLLVCWLVLLVPALPARSHWPLPLPPRNPAGAQAPAAGHAHQHAPKLDGVLDEAVWQTAPIATQFYELEPTPGRHEKHPTEVRVLYDDAAIYVGAIMHDVSQDSILRELSARDNIGNSDWFGVFFDTYNDHLNGYEFIVIVGRGAARCPLLAGQRRRRQLERRVGLAHRAARHRLGGRNAHSVLGHSLQQRPRSRCGALNFGRQRRSTPPEVFLERGEAAGRRLCEPVGRAHGPARPASRRCASRSRPT